MGKGNEFRGDVRPIGVFDSGVGGLKVLAALRKALPGENFIYVFDRSHAPYGNKRTAYVRRRTEKISSMLVGMGTKCVVVACNTATNVGIDYLRARFDVPFVGVEPPIKPAVENGAGGKILVLTTRLTAKQDRFIALKNRFFGANLEIVPLADLAGRVEESFSELSELRGEVERILSPHGEVESVVLGCTHYYYLAGMISDYYGGKVKIYDALGGVVKRVESVLGQELRSAKERGTVKYIYL